MSAIPEVGSPASTPPSRLKSATSRNDSKQKFWNAPGMDMFIEWATDSDINEKLINPRPVPGQRAVDLYDEIAAKVNAKHGTKWDRKAIKSKLQYAKAKYDAAKKIARSLGDGEDESDKSLKEQIEAICPPCNKFHAVYGGCIIKNPPPERQYGYGESALGKRAASIEGALEVEHINVGDSVYEDLQDSEVEDSQSERSESVRPERGRDLQQGISRPEKRQKTKGDDPASQPEQNYDQISEMIISSIRENRKFDLMVYELQTKRIQEIERRHMEMLDKREQEIKMMYNRKIKELTDERAEFAAKMERERLDFKEEKAKFKEEKVEFKEEQREFRQEVKAFQKEEMN
ncbi:hypothetical protein BGZ80_005889 [Entomortierella chlamydospora]|uniref:Myb/SANT-like domain-containing protein n=1 Tax=Entomortierella chlamydospora TaxID=101097 RepID=A0A9P6N0G2_9FUNG|nr:hypothetical protein BGZ79_004893 [Entomortierella chlamydospora]KAG0019383.1 hypothetical protein BGZ80_005889 [Entomortierella chlamydospora]